MTETHASAVTVEDMLAARDARAARQGDLAREFGLAPTVPGGRVGAVVSITLVTPGPDKTPPWTERVFRAALDAATDAVPPGTVLTAEGHTAPTGPQGYLVVGGVDAHDVKRRLAEVEDTHPWGRLFDLDVVVDGRPLTRADIAAPPRRCLVCDGPAAPCARSRTHDLAALRHAIERVLS